MSNYMSNPFEVLSPVDKIPAKVSTKLPNKNKLIKNSTVERAFPTSQTNINWDSGTPSSTTFNIASKGFFIDPDNASLCFSVSLSNSAAIPKWTTLSTDADQMKLAILQNAIALMGTAQLKIGGIVVDDIFNVEQTVMQELLLGVSEPWMNTVGYNQLKLWAHSATATATKKLRGDMPAASDGVGTTATGLIARYIDAVKIYWNVSTPASPVARTVHCEVPLAILFGFFRQEAYLPLAFMNGMEITLNWAPVQQCLFCPNATPADASKWSMKVESLRIIYRAIELESNILSVYKQLVENDEDGLALPYDTKASTVSVVQASQSGTTDLAVSRASSYVKNLYVSRRPGDVNNNMTVLNSGYPYDGLKGAQLNIQSIHVPAYGLAQDIDLLNISLQSGNGSSACNSLMSYCFSYNDYFMDNTFQTPSKSGYAITDAFTISNGANVVAFSLEKDIDSEYNLDGVDSSALGSTFSVRLEETQVVGNTAGNATTRSILSTFKYLRILTLKNSILSIAG